MVPFNSAVNDTCCDVCNPTSDVVMVNLVALDSIKKDTKSDLKGKSLKFPKTLLFIGQPYVGYT